MSAKPVRWMMTGAGKPFIPMEFDIGTLAPDEVLVEIAGCGVCHTDLGYYYDGVRTKHELPLTLGHEISGHVVDTGTDALYYTDHAVIVPAVIPCGHCENAGQRHSWRLRHAYHRAIARTMRRR
jgi:6-hydroxycyclohex-1-ene-1-carbonyl-CoA dehydrogenase